MNGQPQVVILGGGFGGIGAIKKLCDTNARITMIDKRDYHTFQPLLYQVATAELSPNEVGFPLRDLLHHHENVCFHQGAVQSIDAAKKQVLIEGMSPLPYDFLVLALGAVVNFFDTPGAEQYALPMYNMNDAVRIKEQILKMFEAVDKNPALVEDGALVFSIVGGGPTGVELSGALADLLHTDMKEDYPNVPHDKARIVLYEHAPQLLGAFQPKLRVYAQKALEERGVEVLTGIDVSKVGPTSVELSNGETVKTRTLVWAAGLQANPVTRTLGVELAHGGRVPVGPELQVKGHPEIFAIGDIAAMTDGKTGKVLPGLGATALQAGKHVGDSIKLMLEGKQPEPFCYFDKGTMAQVGRGAAVVEFPNGCTMTGHSAWLAWLGVHLLLLNGAEQKSSVFVDWGWNVLTHKRGKRVIMTDEDVASPPPPASPPG